MNKNPQSKDEAGIYLLLAFAAIVILFAHQKNPARVMDTKIFQASSERESNMNDAEQQSAAQITDPVYLNHFYLVLDAQTYEEIKESKFIKEEFAAFEHRTTVRADITYTGIYFYGTHTYFEFFAPGGYNRAQGAGGIASGVEAQGASDRLKQRLESYTKTSVFNRAVTRRVDEKEIPWFHMGGVNYKEMSPKLSTWLMEYHKDFLSNWYPELSPKTSGITRKEILERYTAKIGDHEKRMGKYLEDVVEMTLALGETDRALFIKEREAFGYKITSDKNRTVCEGPNIKYTIIAGTDSSSAISSIKMSLKRDKKGQKVYRFGSKSVLQFNDDRTATWSF
jgi:hypothetical protein